MHEFVGQNINAFYNALNLLKALRFNETIYQHRLSLSFEVSYAVCQKTLKYSTGSALQMVPNIRISNAFDLLLAK